MGPDVGYPEGISGVSLFRRGYIYKQTWISRLPNLSEVTNKSYPSHPVITSLYKDKGKGHPTSGQ
jgi:hypothetical protein